MVLTQVDVAGPVPRACSRHGKGKQGLDSVFRGSDSGVKEVLAGMTEWVMLVPGRLGETGAGQVS